MSNSSLLVMVIYLSLEGKYKNLVLKLVCEEDSKMPEAFQMVGTKTV